jgi:DNA (cytosine-5)-methyltransferase 1
MELSVLDLFSGIGGFSLGLESTGKFKTIGFCEKDKFCQKVLQKHWQDTPIYEDIKKLDGTKIKADVITGGFPCQSISIAGKQKGKNDDRFLFPEMLRVIKETQARWVIGENVQNLLNISNGEILQGIHNDLETIGYEVQTFSISASSQGAWHKRSRVWIVAANSNTRLSFRENKEIQTRGITFNNGSTNVANSNNIRTQVQTKGKHTIFKMFGSHSKKSWWETFSEFYRIPDGLQYGLDKDRTNRIKALGNAIVPQIATEIGKAIIKAEEEINGWN